MALEEIREERIKKLHKLKAGGIDPYPAWDQSGSAPIAELLKKFVAFVHGKKPASTRGRITARREHGGATFLDVADWSGKIQFLFKEDIVGGDAYRFFLETVDIGDFVSATGTLFLTKKGEKTLEVKKYTLLAKSLRPLPEKWHGLQDVEERFRKRYLDLIANEGVRGRFFLRSKIISAIRAFFDKNGFYEVETPILQPIPGGAIARPFKTHHNALDVDLYLRVAPELYLKRLLVGGFEAVYEIGSTFRNEGIDITHNPEFTMLEAYRAYWDEERMMGFIEMLLQELATAFGVKGKVVREGESIAFKKPFTRIRFKDALARYALITDYDRETRETFATRAKQFGIEIGTHESKGKIADEIYKKVCRPHFVQPTFVVHHPLEISPLAKKRPENQDEVRRFQLVVAGAEIVNGFAELNDPLDQRERFLAQEKERAGGEEEAHRVDEDFVEALEYGMPPAAGIGVGIDRLIMLFTDMKNIREVVLFPTLRPRQ